MSNIFSAWPVANPVSDVQLYDWITQIPRAIWERQWVSGNSLLWPPFNHVHGGGVVESAVDNEDGTITITAAGFTPLDPGRVDNGYWWNNDERPPECGGGDPYESPYWVGLDCGDEIPWNPANYDVCIDVHNGTAEYYRDYDPRKVVRGSLLSTTNNTATIGVRWSNYQAAGYQNNLSDLVGKTFSFIRSGSLYWASHEYPLGRYPDFPNDEERWRGVADAGKVYADGTGWLHQPTPFAGGTPADWHYHRWDQTPEGDPCEVLVYSGQELKRLGVTGNTSCKVFFGGLTQEQMDDPEWEEPELDYLIGGVFTIVKAGNRGWPERTAWSPFVFNTSNGVPVYGHAPNDAPGVFTTARVQANQEWHECDNLDECGCEGDPDTIVSCDLLDRDCHARWDQFCDPQDFYWSPHYWKCMRHWQVAIEGLIAGFVRAQDYGGTKEIVPYSRARAFLDAIPSNGGTASLSVENYEVTVDNPPPTPDATTYYRRYFITVAGDFKGKSLAWEAVKNGRRVSTGEATSDATTGKVTINETGHTSSAARTAATAALDATWSGATVYWHAGWTRYYPLRFSKMYETTAFIPSETCEGEVCTADYPPSVAYTTDDPETPGDEGGDPICDKVGAWVSDYPSQGYKVHDDYGSTYDIGHTDSGPNLVVGKHYRYDGINWHEGRLGGGSQGGFGGEDAALAPFRDRFYEGRFSIANETALELRKVGRVGQPKIETPSGDTSLWVTDHSISDETKSFWDHWYSTQNEGYTHTGNVEAGTTTTIDIGSDYNDTEKVEHCWMKTERFIGRRFQRSDSDATVVPFKGFILELRKYHQRYAFGGEPKYVGDGTETFDGTWAAGEEITDINGDPWLAWHSYKVPITDVTNITTSAGSTQEPRVHFLAVKNAAGVDVSFDPGDDEPGFDTTWTIEEPGTHLDFYRGKRLRFIPPEGSEYAPGQPYAPFELDILHNDDKTLYFEKQTNPLRIPRAGWSWIIVEQPCGGVWQWSLTAPSDDFKNTVMPDGSLRGWQKVVYRWVDDEDEEQTVTGYWLQPMGSDSRGADWKTDSRANLPHKSARHFGRIVKGDYIDASHVYAEMYAVLNKLVWTVTDVSWSARADPAVPELNTRSTSTNGPPLGEPCSTYQGFAEFDWDAGTPYEQAGPPMAVSVFSRQEGQDFADLARRYAYAVVDGLPTLIAHKVTIMVRTLAAGYNPTLDRGDECYGGCDNDTGDPFWDAAIVCSEFDTFGDAVGGHKQWSTAASFGPSKLASHRVKVGSTDIGDRPDWASYCPSYADLDCTQPPDGFNEIFQADGIRGYYIDTQNAIVKWNVAGGLRYVDTTV